MTSDKLIFLYLLGMFQIWCVKHTSVSLTCAERQGSGEGLLLRATVAGVPSMRRLCCGHHFTQDTDSSAHWPAQPVDSSQAPLSARLIQQQVVSQC